MLLCLLSQSTLAQGSIFGTVHRADLSVPPNGSVVFFGFINDRDDEIRLSSSVGAGYDNGSWFDDFQNYLSKAPGQPYDYYFFDTIAGESFHLAKTVPNNSFQQEDVILVQSGWPSRPANVRADRQNDSTVVIHWLQLPGRSYHVYRRDASSNGSLFRIDDPAGSLFGSGVVDSQFVDTTVMAGIEYTYTVVAEDGNGLFSPPSDLALSTVTGCCVGLVGNVNGDINDESDVADLTMLIDNLFISLSPLPCPAEANINGDPDGTVDVADLTAL
ncbi:MAG: hypothetical protein D6800_10170, partial [Candidatus Zixiibacteriota bacterium]